MILIQLFYEFFKAGLFAVGGGLATLPFLQDISAKTGWFTLDQLADMIAMSECTPGPIGVNMATYVGFSTAGVPGALAATLGLIAPSIIVILIIAGFLKRFQDNRYVQAAFYGLRPASTGLIGAACISVAVTALLNLSRFSESRAIMDLFQWKAVILAVILFFAMKHPKLKKLHPAVFLGASAVIGVLFGFAV